MTWTPHIDTSTQTLTNGVPDVGYEVMGQNFVYANYPTHSLYTHFMYKKTTTPSGADASFEYWDLYLTRDSVDTTWLHISNSPNGTIKYKSGTWSDHGSSSPNLVTLNGTTVTLSQSGVWGDFTDPYQNSGGSGGSDPIVTVKSIALSPINYPGRSPNSLNPFAGGWIWSQDSIFSYITAIIDHHASSSGYDIVWDNNTVRGTITDSGVDTNGDWFVTTRLPITVDVPDEEFSVEETDTGTGTVGVIDGTAKFRRKVSLNFW